MADVLLVYPSPGRFRERRFGFSLHLLYIAAVLERSGHRVSGYLDYSIYSYDHGKFDKKVDNVDVVIMEFDSFALKRSLNIGHGRELLSRIRSRYPHSTHTKRVVVFGDDTHLFPKEYGDADCILNPDPEYNICAVVDSLVKTEQLPVMRHLEDMDWLPYPKRNLLSPFASHGGAVDHEANLAKSTLIRTARGCINSCVFCQRKAWQKIYQSHSLPYVLEEFSLLKQQEYRNVWVTDENFTHNLSRAKNLLKLLADEKLTVGMKISLSSWTRIDEEFLHLARSAHVSIISFGVESANPEILDFYRKRIDLKKFHSLISFADSIGLYTVGNFIIGAPMETEATMEATFSYILATPFDQVNIKILDYMAGAPLYEQLPPDLRDGKRHVFACKENGLNDFPLKELQDRITRFRTRFRHQSESHFKDKMKKYGPPYKPERC